MFRFRKIINNHLLLAGLAMLTLTACASQPTAYQADEEYSRAYHLAQAAGMWRAKDYELPRDQSEGLTSATFDIIAGAASFHSSLGLGLALGDAAGLSVLSHMFAPPAQLERNTVLAWIPSTEAKDKEQAVMALSEALYEATLAMLSERDIGYSVEYHDRSRRAVWYPFYETRINFTYEGKQCVMGYQLFPDQVSDEAPIPEFIMANQTGYRFWAAHEIRYPVLDVGCPDADPAEGLRLASLISERLPEGIYFYMAPRASADRLVKSPPMLLEKGRPLLFVTPST